MKTNKQILKNEGKCEMKTQYTKSELLERIESCEKIIYEIDNNLTNLSYGTEVQVRHSLKSWKEQLESIDENEIIIKFQGLLTTYECSCGGEVEPSEIGYFCECGAKKYSDEIPENPNFKDFDWDKRQWKEVA